MHNKVVVMAARSLRELGAVTVRFNFRGTGASDGLFDHGDGETDGPLGGPNDGTTPTGGSTDPNVPSEGTPGNAPGTPGL